MPHPSSAFVRLLLRAYPSHLRQREGDVLEAVCVECLARERRRLGRFGVAYACGRLIADTLFAAIVLRADERRRRRVARAHVPLSAPKEILMTRLWQDVRYAARRLPRAPIFSLAVIATLALTIGATTAVFTVVNAVLLRGLPYRDPSRLVLVQLALPQLSLGFSPPDYVAFEARAGFFETIAAYRNRELRAVGGRAAGARDRHAGIGDALRDPRRAAGARPSFHARRGPGGAAGRRSE